MLSTHRVKARTLSLAALAATAGVLAPTLPAAAATTGLTAKAAASSTPVQGGNLRIAFSLNVQNCIDPGQAFGLEQRDLDRNLVDSLTDQNPQTGQIIPWLATSWKVNANGSVYTFQLRHGVTFSDGTPFNAQAVKTAYDATAALGALSELGETYFAGYKSTTVLGPYTVQVAFNGPNAEFLQASATTTLGILSPATYKESPATRCLGPLVGTGPFTLTSFTPGESAVLTRRPGYHWASAVEANKGSPYLNTITASWIPEESVLVGSLDSGQIDLAWPRVPISGPDQALIKSSGNSIFSRPYPGISDLLIPNVTPGRPLADPVVRQALQESINRQQLATTVFYSGYPSVTSPLESTTPDAANLSNLLAYNPKAAEAALTKDGWVVGSDGIRVKNGQKLTLIFPVTAAAPAADLLQAQLKTVGINLQQDLVTVAQDTTILDAPGATSSAYDLAESYLTRGDPSILASILDTGIVKTGSAVRSQSLAVAAQVTSLFTQGAAAVNPVTRATVYKKLQTLLVKDGVTFPIDERLEVSGVSSKVHGLEVTDEGLLIANDIWLGK